MAKFPKIGDDSQVPSSAYSGESVKQDTAKEDRKPRVVLTENAIFPREWIKKSATTPTDAEGDGHHHQCSVGDTVMMTDSEFEAHQKAGVCVINQDEREAA